MSEVGEWLELEADLVLGRGDRRALERARSARFDPSSSRWEWISLRRLFPRLPVDRSTAAGREEFELLLGSAER